MSIALPIPSLRPSDFADFDIGIDSLRRFTVAEYHALVDAGYFAEDEKYELLEGLLVHKKGKKRAFAGHSPLAKTFGVALARLLRR